MQDSNHHESPDELLQRVSDRESFLRFLDALAEERERAREIELAEPNRYVIDGALGWKNAEIDAFLGAARTYFTSKPFHTPETVPSWRMFAGFLYCGKVVE